MRLIEQTLRLPVTVTVVVLLIVLFGLLGLRTVPVQLTPNVDQPVISVTTNWFGASPQEMVREVAERQEEVLKTIDGLAEMTSQSSEGQAVIRLQFPIEVDRTAALNEVRDKLRQVTGYPTEVDEPVVESVDSSNRDYIAWIMLRPIEGFQPDGPVAPGFDGDVTTLGNFLDDFVKPVLERAPGVEQVNVLGARERELQVRVNFERLAARGIGVDELAAALRAQNLDVTAGVLPEGKRDTSVRVVGRYDDPETIRQTVVAYTDDGAPVYVGDVAEVVPGYRREQGFVRALGVPVIAINAQRETGSNVLVVMGHLKEAIERVNREVLAPTNWGLELDQAYDQTVYINDALSSARNNLLIGAALAGMALFVTLRSLGATLVVMLAIPVSIIGTFLGMSLTGRSLNVISMAGLTFAVGMGIDNAIVVLENIFRHREMGKDRFQAAADGAKEVWGAILAATLTNIAVFLPIVLIQEEAGQLFRDIAVAVSISMVLYLLSAPLFIPMLSTVFLRRMPPGMREATEPDARPTRAGRFTAPLGRGMKRFGDRFYDVILWLTGGWVRRIALVLVFVVAATIGSWALIPPRDYLPAGNQNLLFGLLQPPPGYNVDEFRRMAGHVEGKLAPWWQAAEGSEEHRALQQQWRDTTDRFVLPGMRQMVDGKRAAMTEQGATPDQIAAAVAADLQRIEEMASTPAPATIQNFFFVQRGNFVFMGGRSNDETNVKPLSYLMTGSIMDIPGTFGFFQQAPIFRIGRDGQGLQLSVVGPNNDRVLEVASAMQGALMGAFDTFPRSDPSNFNLGRPEVQVRVDPVRAEAAGVSPVTVRNVAQAAVDGLIVGDYRELGRSIDLVVVGRDSPIGDHARTPESLADLPIPARDGRIVPLGTVATLTRTTAPQQINRTEEQPSVTFSVPLPTGLTIQEAVTTAQTQVIAPLREAGLLGTDVRVRVEGSADKLSNFMGSFIPGFLLAALVTYLLLASLFESFLYPLVIILSVPFALVGGFAALAILHAPNPSNVLDVLTMLGFVILVGTIVNNPILIVHQALNYVAGGMARNEAIARSTQTRVRPIFMSVMTSVVGMLPLVVLGEAGSELYRGLGAVLIGGLVVSTVFTLFLTPTLMSLLMDLKAGLVATYDRLRRRGTPPSDGTPPNVPSRPPPSGLTKKAGVTRVEQAVGASGNGDANGDANGDGDGVPVDEDVELPAGVRRTTLGGATTNLGGA